MKDEERMMTTELMGMMCIVRALHRTGILSNGEIKGMTMDFHELSEHMAVGDKESSMSEEEIESRHNKNMLWMTMLVATVERELVMDKMGIKEGEIEQVKAELIKRMKERREKNEQ